MSLDSDFFPKTEKEIQDVYKKRIFLETIKTGKKPERKGLGKRLYLLAGFTSDIHCNIQNTNFYNFAHKQNLSKTLRFYTTNYCGIEHKVKNNLINLKSKNMIDVFTKYLKDFNITHHSYYYNVLFDPTKVACWSILDNDLKNMYPNNYRINKQNGFIYYVR